MIGRKLQEFLLKGKVFVIGLTFVDKNGQLIERYQTHGTVVGLTNNGILKLMREDNSIFQMPYDKETIEKAKSGDYKAKSTGQIIRNPDYIATWEITIPDHVDTEDLKKHGFVSPE